MSPEVDLTSKNNQLTYIKNVEGHSKSGKRSLQITYDHLSNGVDSKVYVDTFIPKEIHELECVFYTILKVSECFLQKHRVIPGLNNHKPLFLLRYAPRSDLHRQEVFSSHVKECEQQLHLF